MGHLAYILCLLWLIYLNDGQSSIIPPGCPNSTSLSEEYLCGTSCTKILTYFERNQSTGWAVRHPSLIKSFSSHHCSVIAEVGIARAELSAAILKHIHSDVIKEYHGIDPFLGGYDHRDAMSGELTTMKDPKSWAAAILDKMKPYCDRFRLHHGPSDIMSTTFADASIDCVFLDGDHSYKAVKQDIAVWLPKLKPGGYLYFDDYSGSYMGLVKAVDELTDKNDIKLNRVNTHNNVYIVKPTDGRVLDTAYQYPDNKGYENAY